MMQQFVVVRTAVATYLTILDTTRYDGFWGFHRVLRRLA
jgi:hypothetical protein